MVFLFLLMLSLAAMEAVVDMVTAIVRRVNYPRYRWNRGGRYSFD